MYTATSMHGNSFSYVFSYVKTFLKLNFTVITIILNEVCKHAHHGAPNQILLVFLLNKPRIHIVGLAANSN